MIDRYIKKINILLLLTLFVLFVWISVLLLQTNKKLESNIINVITDNANYFTQNIVTKIKEKIPTPPLFDILKNDHLLREELENSMQMIITPSFQYIYVLYRDRDGAYRYLLDGSKKDKGFFNDFLNVDLKKWNKVYKTKQMIIFKQKNIDSLYITFLTPILYDNNVEAVLAVDFSSSLLSKLVIIAQPVKHLLLLMITVIALLLLSLTIQFINNHISKKKMMLDPLTQIYNRYFLKYFFEKNSFHDYTIVVADIDHFKKINDTYGHDIGDVILQDIVHIMRKYLRKQDALVRFGGEEFLFIIKNDIDHKHIIKTLNDIKTAIEKHYFTYKNEGIVVQLSISMGAVLSTSHFKRLSDAIKQADIKLYIAKKEGRNKIVYLDHADTQTNPQLPIEDIKLALDQDRVFCDFQPIVHLDTNAVRSYELLVRIVLENGKIVYPGSFLDTVAHTNIYIEITKKVLQIAFETIEKKRLYLSVNLSLSDILDNVIYENLITILKQNLHVAEYLTIELLEYENLALEIINDRINEIKSFGVKIALDDFGSGYSNFETLQKLHIDILKIDSSLIKNIDTSKKSQAIVKAICTISNSLSIKTVAEFIHSKDVFEVCKEIGVDMGQGYYIGKPKKLSFF